MPERDPDDPPFWFVVTCSGMIAIGGFIVLAGVVLSTQSLLAGGPWWSWVTTAASLGVLWWLACVFTR